MKRFFHSLPLCLSAVLVAGALTLTGCTSDSLTGADLQRYEQADKNNGVGTAVGGNHNEGNKNNGVGTAVGGNHNEG